VIKPRVQSRKKLIPTTTKTTDSVADLATNILTPAPAFAATETGDATPRTATDDAPSNPHVPTRGRLVEAPLPNSEIQVLELESYNPVVLFQNEVYSCKWSDMIGTNLFFSEHDEEREMEPLRSTEEYDLLGTSRIKLIGRKAKLTSKPGGKGGYENVVSEPEGDETDARPGKGFGSLRSSNPVVNRERRKQAKFLESLMDAKRAKGQTDNVRTVYNTSRVPRGEIGGTFMLQGRQVSSQEIEELNRRVVRGDAAALRRLQKIYSEPDEQRADDGVPQVPTPTPGSTWYGSIDNEDANQYQTDNAQNT
jgi:TFIIIC subunit triple barrel domain